MTRRTLFCLLLAPALNPLTVLAKSILPKPRIPIHRRCRWQFNDGQPLPESKRQEIIQMVEETLLQNGWQRFGGLPL